MFFSKPVLWPTRLRVRAGALGERVKKRLADGRLVIHSVIQMKSASIRDLRHATPAVLAWVEQGHEVRITRRRRLVAVLGPPAGSEAAPPARPDFAARLRQSWGDKHLPTTATEQLREERGER